MFLDARQMKRSGARFACLQTIAAALWRLTLCVVLALYPVGVSYSQQLANDATGDVPWWKHAVFYEVYPRSFKDSNDDGIGNLNGLRSKLVYLHELGVDAIWISPCFPSPQKDFGYDVSNYVDIDPMYGTLADFDRLRVEADRQRVRIILDFVLNHSSDQHPWFLDSRSSRQADKRDWYIWRDGKPGGAPPNNWISDFGGSAWTLDPKTQQYYYHYFEAAQPDLNWRNPAVRAAMFDVTRFWYARGVSGFRLDAVDTLYEDPELHDNPIQVGKNELGDPEMTNKYNDKLPDNHQVLRDLRTIADQHDAVLIGETWTTDVAELKQYYGTHRDELQLPMDFLFMTVEPLSASAFRAQIAAIEASGEWPVFVMSNHDCVRAYTRYGDGKHNDEIAKVLAAMYLTLRGTPILYYGEELGMENNDPQRKQDVIDPLGLPNWPTVKGRDGERTPMQWTDEKNAGFTSGHPWLPVPPSYKIHNVRSELRDPNSVLSFYKQLLALRHRDAALLDGDYTTLADHDPHVLAYLRRKGDHVVLVALNLSGEQAEVPLELSAYHLAGAEAKPLLSTTGKGWIGAATERLSLNPYSVYIAELQAQSSAKE